MRALDNRTKSSEKLIAKSSLSTVGCYSIRGTASCCGRNKISRRSSGDFRVERVRYRDNNRDRANHLHTVAPYETVNNGSLAVRCSPCRSSSGDYAKLVQQRLCRMCGVGGKKMRAGETREREKKNEGNANYEWNLHGNSRRRCRDDF